MNKTQLLSDTENLIYCLGKTHYILIQKWLLYTVQIQGQVTPKNDKQEVLLLLHFWRHLTYFYNTVYES
jgi:hypothetical protein